MKFATTTTTTKNNLNTSFTTYQFTHTIIQSLKRTLRFTPLQFPSNNHTVISSQLKKIERVSQDKRLFKFINSSKKHKTTRAS